MSLRKYLTSPTFFGQVLAAFAIVFAIGFLFIHWLTYATNHGDVIIVPDLAKLTKDQATDKLNKLDLDYVLLEEVDFNPAFPKLSVVEQDPLPGTQVKEGRKVYIKINSSGFKMVVMPDLIQKTYRQAIPTLKSVGLAEGSVTYVPNIAKDMVLEMKCNGKTIKPGDKILKSSKIDLFLGDGKVGFDSHEIDSLSVAQPTAPDQKTTNGK